MPARTLAKDGGVDERFAERDVCDSLHGSSGNWNKAPMIASPVWKHGRFHCQLCKTNFGVNDYDSNTVTCPKCGNIAASTINDFLQDGGEIELNEPPVAFHPTQDPISSTDGSTHALGCGSKQGQASVAIAFSARNRGAEPAVNRPERPPHAMEEMVGSLDTVKPWNVATRLAVRRLTPKECERLMGWPDDHTAGFSDSVRYKMCGNGVVAACSEWIARRIVRFSHTNLPPINLPAPLNQPIPKSR